MPNSNDNLKRALVFIVLGLFTVGVLAAGWLTQDFIGTPRPDAMPEFVKKTLIAINGTLSLNLGLYLGLRRTVVGWDAEPAGRLQSVASGVYLGDVLLAAAAWACVGFTEDAARVAPILPTIVTTGFGVLLAAFGTELGVGTKNVIRGKLQEPGTV